MADLALENYNGLRTHTRGLPADAYFEPRRYQLELGKIWHRRWVYVARSSELARPRAYRTFELGNQQVLLIRDEDGTLRGFYNTCRHRGATLCLESTGELRAGAIVCPYHAWTYSLQGELLRTSSKRHPDGFDVGDYPLYKIGVREWNGFIFVAFGRAPPEFEQCFDVSLSRLDAWPLPELKVAHVLLKTMDCNWKIFWENYNECLHCPTVHPELSQLVPIYGRGLLEERDDPTWPAHAGDTHPRFKGGLREGAVTWSTDGLPAGPSFAGLSSADRQLGAIYMTGYPSMFIVGHVDYVRVVRLRPLAPEKTELRVEYLFAEETLATPGFDPRKVIEFTNRVMTEDAEVCEVNQRGLHASPHAAGVVMPEEYLIAQFHQWVAAELERE